MNFKKGDWVYFDNSVGYWECDTIITLYRPYSVVGLVGTSLKIIGNNGEMQNIEIMSDTHKLPINNALNRKLYPNYIEHGGFLLPPEMADKMEGGKRVKI